MPALHALDHIFHEGWRPGLGCVASAWQEKGTWPPFCELWAVWAVGDQTLHPLLITKTVCMDTRCWPEELGGLSCGRSMRWNGAAALVFLLGMIVRCWRRSWAPGRQPGLWRAMRWSGEAALLLYQILKGALVSGAGGGAGQLGRRPVLRAS